MTTDILEKQALAEFNSGHYQEAIKLYKKLLQESDQPEWNEKIAHSYVARAKSFAERGMFREAAELWENHLRFTDTPLDEDFYIVWLIYCNKPDKAIHQLSQLTASQVDKQYAGLAEFIGYQALFLQADFVSTIAHESKFHQHFQLAQQAFKAYQNGDNEQAHALLNQLPFRSAFKNLSLLIKALIDQTGERQTIRTLLEKIPDYSIYAGVAKLLAALLADYGDLPQILNSVSHHQQNIIAKSLGLNKKQIEFIHRIQKLDENASAKVIFNLITTYAAVLPTEPLQRYCEYLLASYPKGIKDFQKKVRKFNVFELNRMQAIQCERQHETFDAREYWENCLEALKKDPEKNALKIALIYRRLADWEFDEEKINLLEQSLDYDATDKDSYKHILTHYQKTPQSSIFRTWLSKSLQQFPQEIDFLIIAVNAAYANKAFKKVTDYASQILKIDPLNTFAKKIMYKSYMARAYQQIEKKQFHLFEAEIERAEKLNLGKQYQHHINLLSGFFVFAAEDKKQGLRLIHQVLIGRYENPILMHFQATVEAMATGVPVSTILKSLPVCANNLISEAGLAQLTEIISLYHEEERHEEINKALEKIKKPLKQSIEKQQYGETVLLKFTETLLNIQHYELLRHVCKFNGASDFDNNIWRYYKVIAKVNGKPEKASFNDRLAMESLLEDAHAEDDRKLEILVNDFLHQFQQFNQVGDFDIINAIFNPNGEQDLDDEEDELDPFDVLFGHLSDAVYFKLEKQADKIVNQYPPEKLAKSLSGIIDERAFLLLIMQQPEIYSALILLKAAEKLKLDIGITQEQVVACYLEANPETPTQFPF